MENCFSFYDRKTNEHNLINAIGVYLLVLDDTIVYVGQSVTIGNRIKKHREGKSGKYKKFDKFGVLLCDKKDLLNIESRIMFEFTPKHNYAISCKEVCSQQEYMIKKAEKNGK